MTSPSPALKRNLALGAIAIGIALALWALLSRKSDQELIVEQLDRLARVVSVDAPDENPIFRGKRIGDEFETLFTPNVRVDIRELPGAASGRKDLVAAATKAGVWYRDAQIELGGTDVAVEAERTSARVEATATMTGSRGGETRRDTRRVRFDFLRSEGQWLIDAIRVEPPADAPPVP